MSNKKRDFEGQVAFITGGASGIGFGIAKAFAANGMKVMLADIEEDTLAKAVAELRKTNAAVEGVLCDVSDLGAVQTAAKKTIEAFGKVHVIVNNAGVGGGGGPTGTIPIEDWKWTVDVNLMGVVHGCETFVPLMKEHGEGGYIVNTASLAGQTGAAGMGPYNATKFAVVGYTESMNAELEPQGINAAALCPGFVSTNINTSGRNHPDAKKAKAALERQAGPIDALIEGGMSVDTVGQWVLESMEDEELYIFTHPNMRQGIDNRIERLTAAYDKAAASATIQADEAAVREMNFNRPGILMGDDED